MFCRAHLLPALLAAGTPRRAVGNSRPSHCRGLRFFLGLLQPAIQQRQIFRIQFHKCQARSAIRL